MDFVSTAAKGGKAKEWFDSVNLHALIGAVFNYVQMTQEDVGVFSSALWPLISNCVIPL